MVREPCVCNHPEQETDRKGEPVYEHASRSAGISFQSDISVFGSLKLECCKALEILPRRRRTQQGWACAWTCVQASVAAMALGAIKRLIEQSYNTCVTRVDNTYVNRARKHSCPRGGPATENQRNTMVHGF